MRVPELGELGLTDVALVGRGGFATVYRARQVALDRWVAVKLLHDELGGEEQQRIRFRRECAAMGRLSGHPGVVTVYSAGITSEDRLYLMMPFLAGGTLADRLEREGPFPWEPAATAMALVADAVEAAHREDVLHGDIKPANILLDQRGGPQLTDFGIARLADSTTKLRTAGLVLGTIPFMAPERLDGAPLDARCDVYGLGATLCGMLSGREPFHESSSLQALLYAVVNKPPPDLTPLGVPGPLSAFTARAMAKDPDTRPATAAAFEAELREVTAALRPAPPTSTVPSATPPAPVVGTAPPTATPPTAPPSIAASPVAASPAAALPIAASSAAAPPIAASPFVDLPPLPLETMVSAAPEAPPVQADAATSVAAAGRTATWAWRAAGALLVLAGLLQLLGATAAKDFGASGGAVNAVALLHLATGATILVWRRLDRGLLGVVLGMAGASAFLPYLAFLFDSDEDPLWLTRLFVVASGVAALVAVNTTPRVDGPRRDDWGRDVALVLGVSAVCGVIYVAAHPVLQFRDAPGYAQEVLTSVAIVLAPVTAAALARWTTADPDLTPDLATAGGAMVALALEGAFYELLYDLPDGGVVLIPFAALLIGGVALAWLLPRLRRRGAA